MKKTSIFVRQTLPDYIREDASYSKFIEFLESYYDWFDENYQLREFESWIDIDSTLESFVDFFKTDFLPNFPKTIVTDKRKLLKLAKIFFENKGTPDSYRFLFRALFNSDLQLVNMQDFVLIASGGTWVQAKYVRLKSLDVIWTKAINYKLFGTTSKAFGIIENVKYEETFTKVYLSDIKRNFIPSESVQVIDASNNPVYVYNGNILEYTPTPPAGATLLTTVLLGALSNITVDPVIRGQYYNIGDPVVIYGGLDENVSSPIKAEATVGSVTEGGITSISVLTGGHGYAETPGSEVSIFSNGILNTTAEAFVSLVDRTEQANVTLYTTIIEPYANTTIGNTSYQVFAGYGWSMANTGNANTSLYTLLNSTTISTFPIKEILVTNGGSGFLSTPEIKVDTIIDLGNNHIVSLYDIGVLAPIDIVSPGTGYAANDVITISGGSGYGAAAKVTSVYTGNNGIESISYVQSSYNIPYGGTGYSEHDTLTLTITSANGANALLSVPGILSSGATFLAKTNKIGEVSSITLTNSGEDYISTPSVSLRVRDVLVSNIHNLSLLTSSYVYQGILDTPNYTAYIDSATLFAQPDINDVYKDIYILRTYEYKGTANTISDLYVYNESSSSIIDILKIENTYDIGTYPDGIRDYGNGLAKATAEFTMGLSDTIGYYLDKKSLLSENSVLQSDVYNRQSYLLTTEVPLVDFKNTLKPILHPVGTKFIPKAMLISNTSPNIQLNTSNVAISNNYTATQYTMYGNANGYTNLVYVTGASANISSLYSNTGYISINSNTYFIYSKVNTVNSVANTITLNDYVFVGKNNTAIATTLTYSTI